MKVAYATFCLFNITNSDIILSGDLMIYVNNIIKDYKIGKKQQRALNDITLSFNDSGFVSILGPSGCGKTTLLNIIGGLDKPTSGFVKINDKSIEDFKDRELDAYRNSAVGFIFQDINLINHLNVYQNVEISLLLNGSKRKERKKIIDEALKRVGLGSFSKKKPSQLSGGEKQRVAIARAIVNNPKIILADEPTGSLDSKTSIEVMGILKELSNDYLVIMVTHNEELARDYSTRIIRLLDGKVFSDENVVSNEKENSEIKFKRTHLPLLASINLSFRNLLTKIARTLLTAFAGSIGIVAVALVLAVSSGVTKYIGEVQTKSLQNYPIIIRSSTVTSSSGSVYNNREQYPTGNTILVTKYVTNYEHVSQIDEKFVDYVSQINPDEYTLINYSRSVKMILITYHDGDYTRGSTSYFSEMIDSNNFMESQYDVVAGKLPTKYDELALVIDSYNSINANVLLGLGLDYTKEEFTFDEILGITYRYVSNNEYYYYDETNDRYRSKGYVDAALYINSETELKIVGILRESPNCNYPLYDTGILYTSKLTDYIVKEANESDIVVAQKTYGTSKNVLTGQPFTEYSGVSSSQSIDYQYENQMINFASVAPVTRINVYSRTFEDRAKIEEYVKSYDEYRGMNNITYYDYMSSVAKDFATFIDILTKVLIVFGLISLLVSGIMISIITYISVIERYKEIGLLRSIGARKIDIMGVFCSETAIIGVLSGALGILFAYLLRLPINKLVGDIIKNNLSLQVSGTNFVEFKPLMIIILICGNILMTIIAGLIPAIIAAFKQPAKVLKSE